MQSIRPTLNSFFNCRNSKGIKLITRLRTGLSHLPEHKFKHSFQDSLNPICRCGTDFESCVHFFLQCPLFQNERLILLRIVKNIDSKLLTQPSTSLHHPRNLKNHFFNLPIFSSAHLLFYQSLFCILFSLYTDIF